MTNINLLPWREQLREQRQRQFLVVLGGALVISALIILAVHMSFSNAINHQKQRGRMLDAEISKLDMRIKEIQNLKAEKENLIARMNVIQELQTNRPLSVHIFDSMVNIIPDGVHINSIERKGQRITLTGFAESNTQVSTLMRKINNDAWVSRSQLTEIKGKKAEKTNAASKEFILTLNIKRPKNINKEDEKA